MKLAIIGILLILVMISGCVNEEEAGPVASDLNVMYVSPATQTVTPGSTVTVEVKFNEVDNVLGYQFNMKYDPSVLKFVSATRGDFLRSQGHESFFVNPKNETPGELKYFAEAVLRGGDGIPGSGTATVVTFTALKAGTSNLELSGVQVLGKDSAEIAMNLRSGSVVVS